MSNYLTEIKDTYQLTIECLRNTFQCADQKIRKQSEVILNDLSKNYLQFSIMILQFCKEDQEINSKKNYKKLYKI
jgi:hypothetical protein